jgi:copper chaperone CopZ
MSFSSVSVVLNALRLKGFKPKGRAKEERKDEKMTKTIKIEGMSCMHCVNRVKTSLEALKGVESVTVDLGKGKAEVTGTEAADEILKEAVESQGYKVTEIK